MGLSTSEILVIAVVILILLGAKKIPELARSLGRASYEYKKAKDDLVNDTKEMIEAGEKKAEEEAKAKETK